MRCPHHCPPKCGFEESSPLGPKLAMKQIQSGTTVQGICLYSNDTALGHWSLKASHIYEGSTASRVLGLTVPTQPPQFQVYIISITVNWDPGELCSCGTTEPGFIFLITELSWSTTTLSLITVIYTGALRQVTQVSPSRGNPLKTQKCLLSLKMQIIIKFTVLTNCNNVLCRTVVFAVSNGYVQCTGETDKQLRFLQVAVIDY